MALNLSPLNRYDRNVFQEIRYNSVCNFPDLDTDVCI